MRQWCEHWGGLTNIRNQQTSTNIDKHQQTSTNINKHRQAPDFVGLFKNPDVIHEM
jgi:hypothetical protein